MTTNMNTAIRTLDRAPMVEDIVIISPVDPTLFDVVALDDLYGQMVYVRRHASEAPAQWVFLTHVRVIDDEGPDAWS